jgi:hypothetical protein
MGLDIAHEAGDVQRRVAVLQSGPALHRLDRQADGVHRHVHEGVGAGGGRDQPNHVDLEDHRPQRQHAEAGPQHGPDHAHGGGLAGLALLHRLFAQPR